MLYLLDANVILTAHNQYYPIDQIPEFWDWLLHIGNLGQIKIPIEIYEEIKEGRKDAAKDHLFVWIKDVEHKKTLVLDEDVDISLVRNVVNRGYADDLTDDQIEQLGRDPFLIAYALADPDRCVVTTEVSKPAKKKQNRKIPDVCRDLSIRCCNPFELNRELGFSTSWKNK